VLSPLSAKVDELGFLRREAGSGSSLSLVVKYHPSIRQYTKTPQSLLPRGALLLTLKKHKAFNSSIIFCWIAPFCDPPSIANCTRIDHTDYHAMSSRTPDNPESFWQSSSVGDNYCTVEKITLPFAKDLVGQARITESADDSLAILDHGCGTGVIALALHQTLSERSNTSWLLTCEDISPSMITQVQARIDAAGWKNTNAAISDLQKTGLPSAFYSHIFASFGRCRCLN
jgi:hypothetical protein